MSSEAESVPPENEMLEMTEKNVVTGIQPVVSVVGGQTGGEMEQEWVTAGGNFLPAGQDLIVVTQSPNVITQTTFNRPSSEVDEAAEVVPVLETSSAKKRHLKTTATSADEEAGAPRIKRWYRQKFCEAWMLDERFKDWVARVANDPYKAYCRYCKVELRAGSSEFLRHMKTKYHSDVHTLNAERTSVSRQQHSMTTTTTTTATTAAAPVTHKELYCVLEEHSAGHDGAPQIVSQVVQYDADGSVQFMEYGDSLQGQRHGDHDLAGSLSHDEREGHAGIGHQLTLQAHPQAVGSAGQGQVRQQQQIHLVEQHHPTVETAGGGGGRGQPREEWELSRLQLMQPAPAFRVKAFTEGVVKEIRLADYLGKFVLLTFYTDDFNSTSVGLLQELIGHYAEFAKLSCVLLAASTNSVLTHKAWATSISDNSAKIPVPLIADFNKKLSLAFGVYDEQSGCAFPSTFLIDSRGCLRHMVVHDLSRPVSLEEPLRFLRSIVKKSELGKLAVIS